MVHGSGRFGIRKVGCLGYGPMRRLSVVIPNYNYRTYVVDAVQSALDLRWPDVEVIVVDDGSTDDSLSVLRQFEGRITVLSQANQGQRSAVDNGFAASSGDVVIFLDSDDMLPPDLPASLDVAMQAGVSKVQFQMQRIDAHGEPIGVPFPAYRPAPSPMKIRRWFLKTSAYPTPPGSGNAYPRWFLEETIPRHAGVDSFADSTLLAAAPVRGDVVSVVGVCVLYRMHGANDSRLLEDEGRFAREIRRAVARWKFAQSLSQTHLSDRALRRSRELLQFRVVAWRVNGRIAVLDGDCMSYLVADVLRSPLQPGPERLLRRLLIAGFGLALLILPLPPARRLVELRFGDRATNG